MLKLINRIGNGGFGNVDLVEDDHGRRYARKTFSNNQPQALPPSLVQNVTRRFVREAQVQENISHNNIMPVYFSKLDEVPPWFLMPVAESTLENDLRRDKNLGGNALSAIGDILAGLEALHSIGITHRDLKPLNVLRLRNEHSSTYAISDFGLISLKDTQISLLTQTGMRMGSDYYTAPEITADLRHASPMSDIFSVGCILHDIFGTGDRIPCAEIVDDGPYSDIMRCCTRRDPARRFQTVEDLRDAIMQIGHSAAPVHEAQIANLVELLQSDLKLDIKNWKNIVEKIEDESGSQDIKTLLSIISLPRIEELIQISLPIACRLGIEYAKWVKNGAFIFAECDAIANRLSRFFSAGDIECRTEVLLAYLMMGTSHNRWYVEEKFYNSCKADLDPGTANRLALELRVMGKPACNLIEHLERSIKVSRQNLHPAISSTLGKLCAC